MSTASSLTGGGRKNAFDAIVTGTTDSNLVTAVATKKIRVLAVVINQGDTTPATVTFNSKPAGSGTSIYPPLKAAANGGFVLNENPDGWFETNVGEGLSVTTGGTASTTSVAVIYTLVAP